MITPFRLPTRGAIPLKEWRKMGYQWAPDLHFTGLLSPVEARFIEHLTRKYFHHVVTYYQYCFLPGAYSLELQFGEDQASQAAIEACRREYASAYTNRGTLKREVAKQHSFTSGERRMILVRPLLTPEVIAVTAKESWQILKSLVLTPWEWVPYPAQWNLPLAVIATENALYRPVAYTRWGMVGDFVIARFSRDGRWLSLTDNQIAKAMEHLEQRDDGYLNPDCGVETPYQEPFAKYGIPPSGWVPPAGTWFR